MKKHKLMSMLLVLTFLILSLAGCGGKKTEDLKETGQKESEQERKEQDKTEGTETNEEGQQEDTKSGGFVETKLPLTEEPVTFKIFYPSNATLMEIVSNPNETYFFQELEKRTNVHIEWDTPAAGQEATAYNLMIASGNLADIIYNTTAMNGARYPDGLDAAVTDGYFLDLTEMIPQYAPNYYHVINNWSDTVKKATVTDGGKMVGVYQIAYVPQGAFYGLYIREDWLEELGLEIPQTYEEMEEVLVAFKDKKGATAPLSLCPSGSNYDNSMSAGFGVTNSFFQIDGTVKYGPSEEGWREYVTLLNDWYTKGLIDPDYMTQTGIMPDTSMITTGRTGIFPTIYTMPSSLYYPSMEEGAKITPIVEPKKNKDDELHIRLTNFEVGVYYTISAECQKPEIALGWMDYLYSEKGADFANFGVEGYSFEYDKNGEPQYTDLIKQNPDGMSFTQAFTYYCMPASRPVLQDWRRELQIVPEEDLKCYDIWGQADTAWLMPTGVLMTSEENQEYAKIMADITSYVEENTNNFITGVRSLSEFDDYLAQLEKLGIKRAIEIYQAALDRYYAR